MNTQITLLSDDELEIVAGGVQNTGVGNTLQVQHRAPRGGDQGGGSDASFGLALGLFVFGIALAAA